MNNRTASNLFHSNSSAGVEQVLRDVVARNKETLRLRAETTAGRDRCSSTAGGVKLKLVERDIKFGHDGSSNAMEVAAALRKLGFHVILLERANHLDNVLGRLSRKRTGVLHCKSEHGKCDPSKLNISLRLNCKEAIKTIDRLRLRQRASELLFTDGRLGAGGTLRNPTAAEPNGGAGRVLRLQYESLVERPELWRSALRLLRLPTSDACLLEDGHQKRVVQTQREVILNWHAFAPCMRQAGSVYARLLRPNRRPASGLMPRHVPSLCAGPGRRPAPAAGSAPG